MIELPERPAPEAMDHEILGFGGVQRGAASLQIIRPGARFRIAFSYPPMEKPEGSRLIARVKRAKREGVRMRLPLARQGAPGSPVVDGADQAGTTINLRGLTPGHVVREDYWLNLIEADGTAYLHSVAVTGRVGADGKIALEIEPPVRAPFADGDQVELAKPWIEGFIDGESWGWSVSADRFTRVSTIVIEEYQ